MLCQCGCGQQTRLSDRTESKRGVVRGQPLRYLNGHANRGLRKTRYESRDCGHETPCWVWLLALNKETGYGYERDELGNNLLAHRVVYETVIGPIPAGLQLDHLCRNRACVNPAHLEPVTNAENCRRGLKTKLTAEDVRAIRASTLTNVALGRKYGVHNATVSRIRNEERWAGV